MTSQWRVVVFNGRRTLAFAQTVRACASKVPVSIDVAVVGQGTPSTVAVPDKDIVAFPIMSDARIPNDFMGQLEELPPSSLVRLAIIGDVAAETDFSHMVPIIREIVRKFRELGSDVESPVLFIDYESVEDSDLIGRWLVAGGEVGELPEVVTLAATRTGGVCEGTVPDSLLAVEDLLGDRVAYECDATGSCIGVKLINRDDYPKSLWPSTYAKQERLLKQICRISTVIHLAIPYTQIETLDLPEELCHRLRAIDLRGSAIGCTEWLSQCLALTRLNLTACQLPRIPLSMFKCSGLRRLFLCKNRLQEIDGPWGLLGELEVLSFYRNNISIIPDEVGCLSRMKRFNCGGNPVRWLPMSMVQMKELESLQLDRTRISSVPEVCRVLPGLKRLSLRAASMTDSGVSGLECLEKACQMDVSKFRAALFSLNVT